jgi:hypothetical protein
MSNISPCYALKSLSNLKRPLTRAETAKDSVKLDKNEKMTKKETINDLKVGGF